MKAYGTLTEGDLLVVCHKEAFTLTVLFLLITAVSAVVILVAHEAGVNAVAVVTAKLGRHLTGDVN